MFPHLSKNIQLFPPHSQLQAIQREFSQMLKSVLSRTKYNKELDDYWTAELVKDGYFPHNQ